jgi:hypothetical protein
MNDEIPNL